MSENATRVLQAQAKASRGTSSAQRAQLASFQKQEALSALPVCQVTSQHEAAGNAECAEQESIPLQDRLRV